MGSKPNWKNPKDYKFTKKLDRAGWAWEFMRRNSEYAQDFAASAQAWQGARRTQHSFYATKALYAERVSRKYGAKWGQHGPIADPERDEVPTFVICGPIEPLGGDVLDFYDNDDEGNPVAQRTAFATLTFDVRRPLRPLLKRAEKLLTKRKKAIIFTLIPPRRFSSTPFIGRARAPRLNGLSLYRRNQMTEQRFGLTEGLVIAGVPAAGYWFAFLYEFGYCKYFGIPPSFIEIGVLNILVAIIGLSGALALINLYANPLFMLSRGLAQPVRAALFRISIPVVVVAGYALVARFTLIQFMIAAAIFFVPLVFLEFIFPLLTQRNVPGYLNKLESQNKTEAEHETLIDLAANAVGRKVFLFSALLLALSFLAYFAGGYEAKTRRDFMVIGEKPEKVVLKRNTGYLVVAQFERATKSLSTEFALVSSEQQLFRFSYERVGPLVPAGVK